MAHTKLPVNLAFWLAGTFATLLTSASALAQAPTKQWDKTIGGSNIDGLRAIQQTSDGGYVLGGTSYSYISGEKSENNYGPTNVPREVNGMDYWVVKLDANGAKQWDKTLGGYGIDQLAAVQQTTDGGYIVGGWSLPKSLNGSLDYWVVKLDAAGNKQWDKSFGGNSTESLTALQQTTDGGYILGGYSVSNISGDKTQANKGSHDFWIVKINGVGAKQWDKTFGGSDSDVLFALQQTTDGGYILEGLSNSGANGDKTQAARGNWLIKIDANGNKQWDRTISDGSGISDPKGAIQQTSDGGYILGCRSYAGISGDKTQASQGDTDYWVVKLDANGVKQWDKSFGGNSGDDLYHIQLTSDGGYILTGSSASPISGDKTQANHGSSDIWLVKLDAAGNKQWDQTLGGASGSFQEACASQQTADGGYVVGGNSSSAIGGNKTENSRGGADYWVVKLSAAGPTATTTAGHSISSLQVYPNPAHGQLLLQIPAGISRTDLSLTLIDATGRTALHQSQTRSTGSTVSVDVNALSAGLYVLRLQDSQGHIATQRVELK